MAVRYWENEKPEYDPYQSVAHVGGTGSLPFKQLITKKTNKHHTQQSQISSSRPGSMRVVERLVLPALQHPRSSLPAPPSPPIPLPPRAFRPPQQPSTARPWSGAPSVMRIGCVYNRAATMGKRRHNTGGLRGWTRAVKEAPFMPPIPQTSRPHYIEASRTKYIKHVRVIQRATLRILTVDFRLT